MEMGEGINCPCLSPPGRQANRQGAGEGTGEGSLLFQLCFLLPETCPFQFLILVSILLILGILLFYVYEMMDGGSEMGGDRDERERDDRDS